MVLIGCLGGCGIQDWRCRRVSNLWIIAGAVGGSCFYGVRFWGAAGLLLLVGYWLYYFRMIGAGDLKMMALICGFIGIGPGLGAIGFSVGLCGAVTLAVIYFHKASDVYLSERLCYFSAWFGRLIQTKERIAYYDSARDGKTISIPLGSYLFIGTLCYLLWNIGKGVL